MTSADEERAKRDKVKAEATAAVEARGIREKDFTLPRIVTHAS